ncbi:MAG TPA: glycosyl transferase [Cyanobacteria bacterium UBA11049]|nr:glycosyl transferase [Cyanobacteria bacterium UBA11049]
MKTYLSRDKVVSFLLLTLPTDGVSRVILNLAKGFVERGLKVDIVVLKAEGDALAWIPSGARVVELNAQMQGVGKLLYLFSLILYLRKVQPASLIVCRDDINFGSIAKYLAMVKTQVIQISHTNLSQYIDYSSDDVKNSFSAYLLRRFFWFYGLADGIVAVSRGVADSLANLAGRPLKQVRVIYNPVVTPEVLAKAEEPVNHPWFAAGEPPVIVGVGRLQALKDFPTLIRAFALVRQHMPARLMILGDGEERENLETLISELGLTSDIALPGFVSNPYAYMSKASVLAMSSLCEGFGNVIAEALACGTPVVTTDCPSGPAEILDFGKYGSLVPLADAEAFAQAILTTIASPRNSEALRQRAKLFSLDTVVDSYLQVLNSDSVQETVTSNTFVQV